MRNPLRSPGPHTVSTARGVVASLLLIGLGGCASFSGGWIKPGDMATPEPRDTPPRSELVLLNVSEASGWVAYACDPDDAEESETYRIVVIRQASGEIIYDSQVPLTAALCTHGFEMAPDDPRLRNLAVNVDRNIIDPLESYRDNREEADSASSLQEPLETESEEQEETPAPPEVSEPAVSEEAEPADPQPVDTPVEPVSEEEPAAEEVTTGITGVRVKEVDGKNVTLEIDGEHLLQVGERLFVRKPAKKIALPGYDRDVVLSEGEVAGLLFISEVDETSATARVLSGEVPENGTLERTENE